MKRPCIAWMSTKFPLELAQTFELEVYCPESFAAASARKGQSTALLQRAADLGATRPTYARTAASGWRPRRPGALTAAPSGSAALL